MVDSNSNTWNITLIHANFTQRDAMEIIKMSRNVALGEDQLIWDLSRNGNYSVKLAYYHAMENLVDSSHLRVDGNW